MSTDPSFISELQKHLETARPLTVAPDATPCMVIANDQKVVSVEEFLQVPTRIKEKVTLQTLDAFIEYVKAFKDDITVIFADEQNPSFTAYIDYHAAAEPSWVSHVAHYPCPLTPAWQIWKASNKKAMSQADFAQFIEDNLPDIIRPASADMVAVSRSLEARKNVDFSSSIRLDNGEVQFKYSENIQGSVQQGAIQIPERFTLGIAIFQGDKRYEVDARFRYRIGEGGKLALSYDLFRPDDVVTTAAQLLRKTIVDQLKVPVYVGKRSA